MLAEYLEKIQANQLYLNTGGKEGAIADLSGADLSGVNLSGANLSGESLSHADLSGENLSHANLSHANLSHADLSGANLSGANLSGANLSYADLSGADLSGANLSHADLSGANLSGANLSGANLSGANLSHANLSHADLSGVIGIAPVTNEAIAELLWVAKTVLANPGTALKMSQVHVCETTHCAAGWVCFHNPVAHTLEKIFGWNVAACIVCPIPEFTRLFYSSDKEMIEFLHSVDADQGAALRVKYSIESISL